MFITKKEWNDDLVGFCCETEGGKYFQVQFELETNRLHADFNTFFPVLDLVNDYDINVSDAEIEEIKSLISKDKDFLSKAEYLTSIREKNHE